MSPIFAGSPSAAPRTAFDFIEGGCEDELGLRENEAAFEAYQLLPRYLVTSRNSSSQPRLSGRNLRGPSASLLPGLRVFSGMMPTVSSPALERRRMCHSSCPPTAMARLRRPWPSHLSTPGFSFTD